MNTIVAIQTENNSEKIKSAYDKVLSEFHGLEKIISAGDTVLIKPNLVAPFEKATTDLQLLEYMIETIKSLGGKPVVAESSGFEFSTEKTFRILGVDKLCKKHGAVLINLDKTEFVKIPTKNPYVTEYLLPKVVLEADKIINMPCLKGHSLTKVTFSIKNLFGLLHRKSRRKIHATNLDVGIAELAKLIPVDFVFVDGLWNLINAVYSDTVYQGILVAGTDMRKVDQVCCNLFGVDYKEIPHINLLSVDSPVQFKKLTKINCKDNNIAQRSQHFIKQNKKYKLLYTADLILSPLFKKSIIPYCHYYMGVRPYINKNKCTMCGKCAEVCPVRAIHGTKIDSKKCMKVRCFKCFDICREHAVEKKGMHK